LTLYVQDGEDYHFTVEVYANILGELIMEKYTADYGIYDLLEGEQGFLRRVTEPELYKVIEAGNPDMNDLQIKDTITDIMNGKPFVSASSEVIKKTR